MNFAKPNQISMRPLSSSTSSWLVFCMISVLTCSTGPTACQKLRLDIQCVILEAENCIFSWIFNLGQSGRSLRPVAQQDQTRGAARQMSWNDECDLNFTLHGICHRFGQGEDRLWFFKQRAFCWLKPLLGVSNRSGLYSDRISARRFLNTWTVAH